MAKCPSRQNVCDIARGLVDVALDIHGETWRLRDGQSEIQRNYTRDAAETDDEAPHVVDMDQIADTRVMNDSVLVRGSHDEGDQCGAFE